MTQPQDLGHDDRLVRYLLGLLPGKDAERLDELTVADDEMAWRLRVAENDLVDAYVSGTLTGLRRERFESFYLSSEHRRRKVRFARSFLASVERDAEATDIERVRDSIRAEDSPLPRSRVLSPRAAWGLAAAAALFLLAGGTLYDDARLHRALDEARRVSDALSNRAHDLERQLNDHRVADASLARELENVPATRTTEVTSREVPVVALVLLPQTRALGPVTTLAVPQGVDRIALELSLEPNDYRDYQVALRDPGTSRIVWRSNRITARTAGDVPTVSVIVPASVLKAQHYSLELDGLSAGGGAEVVGTYVLQIMEKLGKRGTPAGVVEDVAVLPARHGQGIGRAMMEHAREACRAAGCYKLALSSNLKREDAHRFYDSLGFERHGFSFITRF